MGLVTENTSEFATFELARLGYDVSTQREVASSTEDADDLLLLTLGDDLDPEVLKGLLWAIQNRPVNWALHLDPTTYTPVQQVALQALIQQAGFPTQAA